MPRKLKETNSKAGRRGNNEGTIYQRPDGRWCGQAILGYTAEGKPIRKTVYGKTRQEVVRKITELTGTVFEKGYISVSPSDKTLFMDVFMNWFYIYKVPSVGSITREKNENYIKSHIKPALGTVPLMKVDTARCRKLFNDMQKRGIAHESVKQTKQLLNQFFVCAKKQKMLRENPLEDIVIRKSEKGAFEREGDALTPEQRKVLLGALEDHPVLRAIVIFMLLTGVRPGELIALRWRDIGFDEGYMSIQRAAREEILYGDDGRKTGRETRLGNTKTVLSVRSFNAPNAVLDSLLEWRDYQTKREAKTGLTLTAPDSFVFCTESGKMRTRSSLRSMLNRFLVKTGMADQGIHPYTFRHTFASILLEQGENPKVVQELMGHAKLTTTLGIYSHIVSKRVFKETAATLDNAFDEITSQE